jgi:hypothetical protein
MGNALGHIINGVAGADIALTNEGGAFGNGRGLWRVKSFCERRIHRCEVTVTVHLIEEVRTQLLSSDY